MSRYINSFQNYVAFKTAINTSALSKPYVAYNEAAEKLYFNDVDYAQEYITIISTSDNNTIGWQTSNSNLTKTISISTDNGSTWSEKTSNTSGETLTTLNTGDRLLIKGSNTAYSNNAYYNYFTSSGQFNVEGNIMSLIYGDNFVGQTALTEGYTFDRLFINSKVVNAINLILPATTLLGGCYQSIFQGCSSLTTPPVLPATILANYCYKGIFQGCSSLTTPPVLPATTLANYCYSQMFYGCTGLTTAPVLPATTLATYCYNEMFYGCTGLTTAPVLPATTLATNCYKNMFRDCFGLTTAPVLPATTLANYCYSQMFRGCTNLTTSPILHATTLVGSCYEMMFYDCYKINYITCLATSISASGCLLNWVKNTPGSGTFVKAANMTSWTTGVSGIPSGWTVQDA